MAGVMRATSAAIARRKESAMRTARVLGLEVPTTLLALADEVIE